MASAAAAVLALQPRHCFGALGGHSQGLAYVDEGTLAYLCGHSVVLYSPDTKAQRFLAGSPDARITAFAVCPSRRLLALAERGDKATITIFDLQTLKRRKILASASEGTKEYISLAFSGDGKLLLTQGGAPEWALSLWVWEKSKLVASVRTATQPGHTAVQCLFQPGESPQYVSVVGEGTCCLFSLEAGSTLRPLPCALSKRESQQYCCHAWLVDNDSEGALVVGSRRGVLLVVGEGEVRQALQLEEGCGVESLAAFGKGFVAGTSRGRLAVFERDSGNKPYRLGRVFAIEAHGSGTAGSAAAAASGAAADAPASAPPSAPSTASGAAGAIPAGASTIRACSLAVSLADDGVACLTSDNQLVQLTAPSGGRKGLFSGVQPLAPSFHAGEITGLATCARRTVVATAGADRTLRIWNYQDKSAELVKAFDEEACSLALHPTGYMLLAGFTDKLRLMTVLSDDLRVVKELPIKAARECCFSNGGQYFAAVNNNTVHVYYAYTCASLAVLRGHNGKVRGLWWSSDDTRLITAGVDGAVYEWKVLEGRRARDFVQKGWSHTCVAGMHAPGSNPANSAAVAGGPSSVFVAALDKKLRALEEATGGSLQVAAEVDAGTVLTHLVAPTPGGRLLFAATEDGTVRSYKLPLTPEFQAVRCGAAPATRLAASLDEAALFAATADGCLYVYDVKDRDAATRFLSRREGEGMPFAEEVLVGRGEIDERRERMADLETQVAEVTAQNEYQLKLKDLALNEKLRELTDKATNEAAAAAQRYNALLADRAELEVRYEERLRAAEEAASAQLVALDSQFQQKLIHEMERYQELAAAKEALGTRWEQQAAALVEQHARVVDELKAGHASELAAERARYGTLAAAREDEGREAAEVRRQMEEDVDREVEELKERNRKQLQTEADANLRLKGENGVLRKRIDEQQKLIEEGRAQLRAADAEKRQLQEVIEGLRRDVAALQRDMAGRDDAIAEKEKRILDLKHTAQELEKFKFVLEYSIGELRAQLDPKELQLADMRDKVAGMEGLVSEAERSHGEVSLELERRKQREAALHREVARQRAALAEAAHKIRQMQCGIQLAVERIQSPDQLKEAVVKLFQAHAEDKKRAGAAAVAPAPAAAMSQSMSSLAGTADAGDMGGMGELGKRQAEMLERTVEQLRAAVEAEKRSAAATHRRMVAENAELIKQLREAEGSGCAGGAGPGAARRGAASPSAYTASAGPSRVGPSRVSPSCDGSSCYGGNSASPSRQPTVSRGSPFTRGSTACSS